MKPEKSEDKIIGAWVFVGKNMHADDNTKRIEWLTTEYLTKITTDGSGWDVLYQDSADKRFWERIYPHSEMQGGGPPALFLLSEDEARSKYSF